MPNYTEKSSHKHDCYFIRIILFYMYVYKMGTCKNYCYGFFGSESYYNRAMPS